MTRAFALSMVLMSTACLPKVFEPDSWEHSELGDAATTESDSYACMKENTVYRRSSRLDDNGYSSSAGDEVDVMLYRACMQARGYALAEREKSDDSALGRYLSARPEAGSVAVGVRLAHGGNLGNRMVIEAELDDRGLTVDQMDNDLRVWPGLRVGLDLAYRPSPLVEVGLQPELRSMYAHAGVYLPSELTYGAVQPMRKQWAPYATVTAQARLPMFPRLGVYGGLGAGYVPGFAPQAFSATGSYETSEGAAMTLNEVIAVPARAAVIDAHLRAGLAFDLLAADPHGLTLGCGVELPTQKWLRGDCSVAYRFGVPR